MKTSVIYINWDGFAKYYLDLAFQEKRKIDTLRFLIVNGSFYEQAYTLVPSITNPMQASLVSGVGPRHTDNHFMYYDRNLEKVVRESPKRKNYAETIAEALRRQGLSLMSINQFALENRGSSKGQKDAKYIHVESESGLARFDYLINYMKKENELPDFIAIYLDELDSIGHNHHEVYGYPIATSESERLEQILDCLEKMDEKLGEVLETADQEGFLEDMNILLTSDHGMTISGRKSPQEAYYRSQLPDLIESLESLSYRVEYLKEGEFLKNKDSDLVLTGIGQQILLSHLCEEDERETRNYLIKQALAKKPYIGKIVDHNFLEERHLKKDFADLIISPKPPYSFQDKPDLYFQKPRGHHDSLDPSSQRVPLILWGKDIRRGLSIKEKVYVQSLPASIAYLLDVLPPFDSYYPPLIESIQTEESSFKIERKVYQKENIVDDDYQRIDLLYRSEEDLFVSFYYNGQKQTRLFFPNTFSKLDRKTLNFRFEKGASYHFLFFSDHFRFEGILTYQKHQT